MQALNTFDDIELTDVAQVIQLELFNNLGVMLPLNFKETEGEYIAKCSTPISTSTIGVMGLVISKLDVAVTTFVDMEMHRIVIVYNFSYKHVPNGGNGFTRSEVYNFRGKLLNLSS